MDIVNGLMFVCLFLIGLCAIGHYFRKSPLPIVCWFVLFGAAYGILRKSLFQGLPELLLSSDLILYIFLPVLIFDSSRKLVPKSSIKVMVPAIMLATLGIVASMFLMALPLSLMSSIPWLDILLFCAIMSATDPVAVTAVFETFPIPEKLRMLIEGESLLNDGTTIILFTLLTGRVIEGHVFLFDRGIAFFVLSVAESVAIGALAGWGCMLLLKNWKALKDHFVGPLFPLLCIYLVFCVTQAKLDVSGVIAVMAATLVMRGVFHRLHKETDFPSRCEVEFYNGFWDFLGDLANAVLFFMLGVEIGVHSGEIVWRLLFASVVALVFARSAVVYGFGLVFKWMGFSIPRSWQHVLNLGGLKGALCIALVLMLPRDYAYREVFLLAALTMSLFTLLVNTLTMRAYLKTHPIPA